MAAPSSITTAIDYARYYPIQKTEPFIYDRCYEIGVQDLQPARPQSRALLQGPEPALQLPINLREKRTGRLFHGDRRLGTGARLRQPTRKRCWPNTPTACRSAGHEWDNRHFWRVSNAEHLGALRERRHDQPVPLRDLRRLWPRRGPALMEYVSSSKGRGRYAGRQRGLHQLPRRHRRRVWRT